MRWILTIWLLLMPLSALANEEDKGRLTRFLEDTLSGAGREVQIEGFEGALSSHATMKSLIISDSKGPWLTLNGVELIWTRSAVLRGRIEVEKLIAKEILIPRLPEPEKTSPSPEASGGFALPELPVSVNIGEINAARVAIGEPVFGVETTVSLVGSMLLLDGTGAAKLDLVRTDGQQGHIRLEAGYANADEILAIEFNLQEAPNGIAATLMSLPGQPSVDLSVRGTGPIDEYVANIALSTDDQSRLTGTVATKAQPELDDKAVKIGETRQFGVDIIGDLAPLFAPEYESFFGPNMSITSIVRRPSDGRTRLDQLLLNTRSMQIAGEMTLAANGLPEFLAFDINLGDPDGSAVNLPFANDLSLGSAVINARYDVNQGDAWSLRGRIEEIVQPTLSIAAINLDSTGAIHHFANPDLSADISLDAIGISATDPDNSDAAEALGPIAKLATKLKWRSGDPVELETLHLRTDRSEITASGLISGPIDAMHIKGQLDADVADLAFLEPLLDRPVRGAAKAALSGEFSPVSGAFDILLNATASGVQTGEEVIDSLVGEQAALNLSAARSDAGIDLRQFELRSDAIEADAQGHLKTGEGSLTFNAALDDVKRIVKDYSGSVTLAGTASQTADGWLADVDGTAPGQTTLSANLSLPNSGGGDVSMDLQVGQVQVFAPSLPGSAAITAQANRHDRGWSIDLDGRGSAGIELRVNGDIDDAFQNGDLIVAGSVPIELANVAIKPTSVQGSAAFDLAVKGPMALESVSGTIQTSGARVSIPQVKAALGDLAATITLSNGSAAVAMNSVVVAGGALGVNGTLALAAPFNGNLDISIDHAKFQYENLLETVLVGNVNVNGPLTGGAKISGLVELDSTEIKVSTSALGGAGALPDIKHRNAKSGANRTRQFAGAIIKAAGSGSGGAASYILDLIVQANNKVFVRGLGLDAEFQGQFALAGPTNAIVTSGEFDLSRGRLDFLTKRLDLTEGLIRLEGDFIPYIRMIAETETSDASFEIVLEGRATEPDITINSSPSMPDEEALSQILFGRTLTDISAFQAAQLAAALASLNGGGSDGLFSKLRKGFGVDNIDITTDDEGNAGVSAGKHINDKLYSEIGVDGKGQSSISLNYDVTPSITLKGRVDSDSDTAIGIFFKRDY
ncbi:autotransporter secretion inner membrane protein TamB [Shimia gijangensis]|uniref:Autotransporter secretion inner membrane protein TamB n=1 Tax=Shimia gijangensis TaxID=1470563 RepID=A0A1M6QJW2_9RHOB|nr:translocation/assembly module TamB domain-containing protein [Shimia gijangensis]SHK20522.1 autotransporter secretion inner membrane protein TamB [Shimia gijangensis]